MTLSINSPSFQISSSFEIPESLRQLLNKAWQNHYKELYEEDGDGTITLEDTLSEILDILGDKNDFLRHYRYVCMALILALAVEPTVKAYLFNDKRTEKIFNLVTNWIKNKEVPTEEKINELFPQKSVGSQTIDEALDVFKNLLQVLNPSQAKEALLEILDDCLEGYAIFPGSQGRRDLFNWWLLEVVPATWCLQFPQNIYTIEGIQTLERNILQDGLLKIFEVYQNQLLFANLNMNLDEVPLEQLPDYTAVVYFMTIEDDSLFDSFETINLQKVNRYLESFYHLCAVQDWERAQKILGVNLDLYAKNQDDSVIVKIVTN